MVIILKVDYILITMHIVEVMVLYCFDASLYYAVDFASVKGASS